MATAKKTVAKKATKTKKTTTAKKTLKASAKKTTKKTAKVLPTVANTTSSVAV